MTPELLARYDLRIPRYTSYPTAPHFHPGVGPTQYGARLAALDPEKPLSIYLHVPFCEKLCWYCGCNTKIVARYDPVAAFRDHLVREINLVAGYLSGRFRVSHVHWGGGTPTILAADDFLALSNELRRLFEIGDDAEIAVEIDPRTLSETTVGALAAAGVNRASLGVQDFDIAVQRAVNRIQPYAITAQVVEWLRSAGISSLNFDLMYGLPLQTEESVVVTVDQAVTLRPDRVAVFGYAHVPWMKRHQRLLEERQLPDTATRWRQAEATSQRLIEHGYEAIGLDHFARPDDSMALAAREGRLRRNFQGYTTDQADTLIAFGPSAIGALPDAYVQNATDIRSWREAVIRGQLATRRGFTVDSDDLMRREIIERIMCDDTLDVAAIAWRYGLDTPPFGAEQDLLLALAADGLIGLDGWTIALRPLGRPLRRAVAAAFDRYLGQGEARHAKAV